MNDGGRKVRMTLVGADGNAFFLMGLFAKNARRQGWPPHEIDAVMAEARAKDYDHLVATLMEHIEEPEASFRDSGDDLR
jgi:hypothetical protein